MKKFFSIFLLFCLLLCLIFTTVSCSKYSDEFEDGIPKIKFGDTIDKLKQYKNQTVTITGYMSILPIINNSTFYISAVPCSGPADVNYDEGGAMLSDVFAIKTKDAVEETIKPIKIVGTLVFGNYSDSNGYSYSFRIENAEMIELTKDDLPKNFDVYLNLAERNHIIDLFYLIDNIGMVSHYDEMGYDPEAFSELGDIPYIGYEEVEKSLKELNTKKKYNDFLELAKRADTVRLLLNEDLRKNNIDAYENYHDVSESLLEDFYSFVNQFKF